MRPDCDGGGPLSMPLSQTYTGKHVTVVIDRYHRLGFAIPFVIAAALA